MVPEQKEVEPNPWKKEINTARVKQQNVTHTDGLLKLIGYPEWWPRKKGEKNKGKAACVKTETGPILGLRYEDYQLFLKHFSGTCNSEGTKPVANMAYKEDEEVKEKGDYILPGGTKVNGALYVPDFKCTLLSVSRLSHDLYRAVWVFLIKHKSEASKRLMDFHKMVEVQFEKQIKRIRCDNGGEFTSNNMLNFYNEKGILLETTCPHTPQQNGVVERKHRHLLETARALMFDANLPKQFWGECILTAAYVINRLPSKVIKNKTPFELLFNQKPDYEFLRVFGCLAYFTNTNTKGDKFEERGKPRVFLGYLSGTKGYKILDLETRKIIVSRNVNFYEQKFPFKNIEEINKDCIEEPIICHDCHCHDEPILAQNKEQNPMEQDPQMDHDQTNEPNGPHETDDGDETGQINDEGQPNNDEFERNESNEGAEAQAETRPTRTRTQPSRFKDFVVQVPPSVKHPTSTSNQVTSTVRYPISNFVSYDKFSTNHKAFLAAITNNDEPKCFKQAAQDARWREAMQKEVKALEKNGTWTLEYLPEGKRAIDSKWVYKIKFKPNGEVERYKARLVAKGFTQMEGVDYHDTFAPVAKLVTVRTLLAIAVKRDWIIHQLDVNNAFLHGDLDEEVYMKIPQGFSNDNETRVCRLRKSLYGLKQASRNWYHKFTTFLRSLNFRQSKADHSLFIYEAGSIMVVVLIYVDDVIITGNNLTKIQETKKQLDGEFNIKDLGLLKYFIGMELAKTKDGLVLSNENIRDPVLTAYCDSDWLRCLYTRRSRTCYMLLLGWTPISWKTKKQSLVSRSSAEAECRAMASTVSEIISVQWLLSELHVHNPLATPLFCDNQAAQHIANNPVFHERTKHIEMDCYFISERVESKEIIPMKISSKMQIADLLTKGLPAHQLQFLLGKIYITDLHAPS
ncbi:putative RNA-directed DNA polymerase [Tanacetum coccineum]